MIVDIYPPDRGFWSTIMAGLTGGELMMHHCCIWRYKLHHKQQLRLVGVGLRGEVGR